MNKKQLIEKYVYAVAVDAVDYTGIEIHSINDEGTEDKVFGVDGTDLFLHKMQYDRQDEAYFTRHGKRYYIKNFMRV